METYGCFHYSVWLTSCTYSSHTKPEWRLKDALVRFTISIFPALSQSCYSVMRSLMKPIRNEPMIAVSDGAAIVHCLGLTVLVHSMTMQTMLIHCRDMLQSLPMRVAPIYQNLEIIDLGKIRKLQVVSS